jgi:hypothetical protein
MRATFRFARQLISEHFRRRMPKKTRGISPRSHQRTLGIGKQFTQYSDQPWIAGPAVLSALFFRYRHIYTYLGTYLARNRTLAGQRDKKMHVF